MLEFDAVQARRGAFEARAHFQVGAGMTAILGPSGGGKSTLLDLVAGFLAPQAGQIRWQGAALTSLIPARRPVAILFQDQNLFPHLTIAQNVGLAIEPTLASAKRHRDQIEATLKDLEIGAFADTRPGDLSGGQRSRAGLARVLVADKPIVCLDEPFAALGPAMRKELMALTQSRLRGKTVLIVSHAPEEAQAVADHVVFVSAGRATAPRATAAFFANPPKAFVEYVG